MGFHSGGEIRLSRKYSTKGKRGFTAKEQGRVVSGHLLERHIRRKEGSWVK